MSKYVPDISSRRWVIIAEGRTARPDEHIHTDYCNLCPFCPGNERISPGEVYRVGDGEADSTGWKVRVIPNKFPITDNHEVIIHSPSETDIYKLDKSQIVKVFQTYRQRFNFYREKGQVLIFCNRGEHAGASIRHPHSQLVVVPKQIHMDTLQREPLKNIVEENNFFNIYCPDFSQWPYEVWLAPKIEDTMFGDIKDEEIVDLVDIFVNIMNKLEKLHETKSNTRQEFSYNFFIHPKKNWYLRIIPRFVYRAGFELGTGLSVNVTDPSKASEELRSDSENAKSKIENEKKTPKVKFENNKLNITENVGEEKVDEVEELKSKLENLSGLNTKI